MKNKRGAEFFGEHTLNIIIAVVCILIVLGVAGKVYGSVRGKSDLKIAEKVLNELINAIKALKEGGKGDYLAIGPQGWYLVDYNRGDSEIPKQCESDSCLCMCPASETINLNWFKEGGVTVCENKGICIKILGVEIKEATFDSLNVYYIANYISLYETPETLYLEKKNGEVLISKQSFEMPYLSGFLSRKVSFEGQETIIEELINKKIFFECKQPSQAKLAKDAFEADFEQYAKDVMSEEEKKGVKIKGLKILLTMAIGSGGGTPDPIIAVGNTLSCGYEPTEIKEICSGKLNQDEKRGYVKLYICK